MGHSLRFSLVKTRFQPAAQSRLDFLFDFVEESQGPFQGLDVLDTRPTLGNKTLECDDSPRQKQYH